MKSLTDLGLYLHIPFCKRKCAYCDFYSCIPNDTLMDEYLDALILSVKQWGGKINRPIDTIYLGGGTPSLLNHGLAPLLNAVRENFRVREDAEITLEINPDGNISEVLENARHAGVNRLSVGAQSGDDNELKALGRTHSANDTENTVKTARKLGFSNISLDLMLGLPDSNKDSLKHNLDFLISLKPEHISAYILKLEPKTAFFKFKDSLNLPDDDSVSDQYLFMCDYLESYGFSHYEISNFCKSGFESRHNLKYWQCEEYLGIGPSAHSYLGGQRFYYPRDIKEFINGCTPVSDGTGGEINEKLMLALRLSEGIKASTLPKNAINKCELFAQNGLGYFRGENFALTDRGMLVSNAIIAEILEEL